MVDSGGVEITLRDIYDSQQESAVSTAVKFEHLENSVTGLKDSVTMQLGAGQKKMDDHETRIRKLEALAWKLTGAFIAVNGVAVFVEWLLVHKR